MTRRHCWGCTCADGLGRIDTAAPFYALVIEIDRIVWEENRVTRRGAPLEEVTA